MKTCALPPSRLASLRQAPRTLILAAAFQLAFATAAVAADETQIIDLSGADQPTDAVVLNDSDLGGDLGFGGGVGSGPDLSGNGNIVQIIQPTASTAGTTSNGQISYRYMSAPPANSGR